MRGQYDYDLVCIGSGPAGQGAALQAAALGKRVALIEKRRGLGGVGGAMGTIPSKILREAVLFFTKLGGPLDRRGAPRPEDRPSAQQLLRRVDEVLLREAQVVERQLRGNGVEIFPGEASFAGPHTLRIRPAAGDELEITSKNVLIAVGTSSTPPPGGGSPSDSVITCDRISQLPRLPTCMAVVGAGLVGIEYASMFAAMGIEVTVFDKVRRPLKFLDVELVDELLGQLRRRNVTLRLGEEVVSAEGGPSEMAVVHLADRRQFISDLALLAVGRVGCTTGLELAAAGLEPDTRGRLRVDDSYRTTVSHIFAVGDVIGSPTLAATAAEQGRRAACVACGAVADSLGPHFPVGIYSIPEISTVGATELELVRHRVPYQTGVAHYRDNAKGRILGEVHGFLKMMFHTETGKLLGVHIIGANATELIHIGQAVLQLGGGYEYFLQAVFNHPTLAECYRTAAMDAARRLK